jgi:RNA polymerase sigma-70 factor (ECF subfamily)
VLATLIRLPGDFDLAEEALREAFRAALEQSPRTGLPGNPRAWLVSAGRLKGIDVLRRRGRRDDVARLCRGGSCPLPGAATAPGIDGGSSLTITAVSSKVERDAVTQLVEDSRCLSPRAGS